MWLMKNVKLRPIGDLALEIRGTIGAIITYLSLGKYEFLLEQISRSNSLQAELKLYQNNKQLLNDNLVFHDWLRIAQEEVKDLQTMHETALAQIPQLEILSF